MAIGQSSDTSIATDSAKQKRPSIGSQSRPADRPKNPFTISGIRAAIAKAFGEKWLSALENAGMVKFISDKQAREMLGEEALYSKAEDVPASVLQAEFSATEKAYGGKAAFEKAKAEGKTKLNYYQWVQVRTQRFKAWFGDWELPQRRIAPVQMMLAGWEGSQAQLRELATGWYAEHLQGKHFPNDDMGVEVLFSSEGKNASFATSGNLRAGWKAEMVRALPELLKIAVKVQENAPDERRKHDTKAFHVQVVPLQVNGRVVSAKLTLRESLLDPNGRPHKFYDIAALKMENDPEVSGVAPGKAAGPVQPTPSEPSSFSVGQLASAIKGLDLSAKHPHPPLLSVCLFTDRIQNSYGIIFLIDVSL